MSDQRITNLSYLEDMGMGDDSLLIEMIELFLEKTPESIQHMKEYETQKNWQQLAAEAHKLKPNLSYMGLESAKELILEIENSSRKEENLDALSIKISEIEKLCNQAYSELSSELDNLKNK